MIPLYLVTKHTNTHNVTLSKIYKNIEYALNSCVVTS